jgi:hypothetical protein
VVQGILQLAPTTLAFGNQQTATTSTAKAVTLTNGSSTYPLTITSIGIGGDFKQTNNCPASPATLAANASCVIQVTFAPAAIGNQTSTLTVAGAAANSPQSVALTGAGAAPGASGSPDFTLSSSMPAVTAASTGGTATFNIFATPLNNFRETLSFTCSIPSGASCAIAPTSMTMDGTSIPSVAVTVSVAGGSGSTAPPRSGELRHGPRAIFATLLPFCLFGIVMVGKKRWLMLLLLAVLIGSMLFSTSCGGSKDSTTYNKMTPGTYQVSITASSTGTGAMTHVISVPLTVN